MGCYYRSPQRDDFIDHRWIADNHATYCKQSWGQSKISALQDGWDALAESSTIC